MHNRPEPKTPRRAHLPPARTRGAVLRALSFWLWLLAALCPAPSAEAQAEAAPPLIAAQPAELPHRVGEGIVRVIATGDGLSYQWYRGEPGDTSAPVTGGTGALLILPPMDAGGRLWVRVANSAGALNSQAIDVALPVPRPLALWGVGSNFDGQSGGLSQQPIVLPRQIRSDVLKVAANNDVTFHVREDRSLWGMGDGFGFVSWSSNGQIAADVVDVAGGSNHALFLKSDGSLWTHGSNNYGQRGASGLSDNGPALLTTGVARIAAGSGYSLFLRCDGTLWGMGINYIGQLGVGDTVDRATPVLIANNVVEIAAGWVHSGFVDATGGAWSMGGNYDGQLGDGSTSHRSHPVRILSDVSRLALGHMNTLWMTGNGDVWGAGSNYVGQLGLGDKVPRLVPVKIASGARFVAVGYWTSFFISTEGGLWAAGGNDSGELGDGSTNARTVFTRVAEGVRSVAAGWFHTMFLRLPPPRFTALPAEVAIVAGQTALLEIATASDGPVSYQWYAGAVGDTSNAIPGATAASYVTPNLNVDAKYWVRATNAYGFSDSASISVVACTSPVIERLPDEVAAIKDRPVTCVVHASGGALRYQWYRGEPGDTSQPIASGMPAVLDVGPLSTDARYWVRVTNLAGEVDSPAVQVRHLAAVQLWAMGSDAWGQLGLRRSLAPTQIATGVVKIAAAGTNFIESFNGVSLWLDSDGTLWGAGNGSAVGGSGAQPRPIASGVADFAAGPAHTLVVKTDGTLWGLGSNYDGQLGDDTRTARTTLIQIASGVKSAACGFAHSVFVKEDGSVWGMGSNFYRQLGSAAGSSSVYLPVQIAQSASRVAAGYYQTFVIKTDGTLWAVGRNSSGELGDGSARISFTQVATDAAEVACGNGHTWLRKTDGSLWTTGNGAYGQLADGAYASRGGFVRVADGVVAITAGGYDGFLLRANGDLYAAGRNLFGEFGLGATAGSASPIRIASEIRQAALGDAHALFLKTDGTLWSAGSNGSGQLGNGNRDSRSAPVFIRENVAAASVAPSHTLQVLEDGSLWGVGENSNGQIADMTLPSLREPVHIADEVREAFAVRSGSLFIRRDDGLWALGLNTFGRFGTGTTDHVASPTLVATDVRQVSASPSHTLFVKNDNTAWAMGINHEGQFGVSDPTTSSVPIQVATNVRSVCTNSESPSPSGRSAFIKTDGSLWTFGSGGVGLGYPTSNTTNLPAKVSVDVVQVELAANRLIYLRSDGTLWFTGYREEVWPGSGPYTYDAYPVQVYTGVKRFADFGRYLLKDDGSVWIWTRSAQGADGTTIPAAFKRLIAGGVVDLAAASTHATMLVVPPPEITQPPASQTVRQGERVELTVGANGVGTLSYQWRRDGAPLSGPTARTARLVIESAQAGDAGAYDVVVSLVGQETVAGTASVVVHTEEQTSFAEWAAAQNVEADPGADPDGGSAAPALLRYAFKLPATGPVAAPLELLSVERENGPRLAVTFARKGHAPGLSYVVEASSDLSLWTPVATILPGLPEVVTVEDGASLEASSARFLRVRVRLDE